ncbi:MAG: hypothetical protein KC609_19695 [Myxococcales bacterium]|nr:hypothetical protein [Myxococcales bacterium]
MERTDKRILITGCGGPIGVNVTRSLRMAPEALRLVGTDCNRFHLHLALTDSAHWVPPAREGEAYLAALRALIERESIGMILPTHPAEVRALSALRTELGAVRLFIPPDAVIHAAQDKWRTNQTLLAAGVPVPRTFRLDDEASVVRAFDELSTRPVWVRGAGVPGAGIGIASLPCREPRHASAWVDHWRGWGKMIASEYLAGRNLTWSGLFDQGRLVASQSRERLEYVLPHVSPSGITGAPAVSRTIASGALQQTGLTAVSALAPEPHGIFFVDFKENDDGVALVTEINAGRFGTTIHFYSEAGFNFPYALVQLAYGEWSETTPRIDPIAPNTYWIRTLDCGPVLLRDIVDA